MDGWKEGEKYNTIYLDTDKKTAEAYCEGYSNCGNEMGKVKDLDYGEAYMETPLDLVAKVTEAEDVDEITVEGRKSRRIQTNVGQVTLESYYGFVYMVEDGPNKWEFMDVAFNAVKDEEVVPS